MKFQKKLLEIKTSFSDPILSQACIPYKKWKKVAKYHQVPWTFHDLEQQCKYVDKTLTARISWMDQELSKSNSISITPCSLLTLCFPNRAMVLPEKQKPSPEDLITYASINAQAVYKVCKKLEKSGFPGAMKFLESLRNSHKYIFMGSHLTTRLRLENPLDTDIDRTCPICFEDLTKERPAILLPCGHYQCCSCLRDMTSIGKIRGTLNNRLAIIAVSFKCPICRYCNHMQGLQDRYSFWPSKPTSDQL
jgi:hypothetical protein